jgi:hypothetical protein
MALDQQSITKTDKQIPQNFITNLREPLCSSANNVLDDMDLKSSQLGRYSGSIDIILHPIYQVNQ